MKKIYIVFDGPPSHDSGRFVEVEDGEGHGLGQEQTGASWSRYDKDFWRLGPFVPAKLVETLEAVQRWLEDAPTSYGIYSIRQRVAVALDEKPEHEPSSLEALREIEATRSEGHE